MQEEDMQNMITRKHSLVTTAIAILLNIQALVGLFFSLSLITGLLAPGSPIIVSGAAILAGPIGGASLIVALASPVIAWGLWMAKPWARLRIALLEIIILGIGVFELLFELVAPDVTWGVCFALMAVAALILLCLYAGSSIRALVRA
jgi:hypothetical protein